MMNRNVIIVMVLAALVLLGWQFGINDKSQSAPVLTDQIVDQPSGKADEASAEVELTEQQKNEIAAHNKKMESLTNVEPVPIPQVPNTLKSIKLPQLKSLTVNELTDPELNLNGNEAIGSTGSAQSVSSSNKSTIITSANTPVIETVSRQTGIPSADIEAAFNQ